MSAWTLEDCVEASLLLVKALAEKDLMYEYPEESVLAGKKPGA